MTGQEKDDEGARLKAPLETWFLYLDFSVWRRGMRIAGGDGMRRVGVSFPTVSTIGVFSGVVWW